LPGKGQKEKWFRDHSKSKWGVERVKKRGWVVGKHPGSNIAEGGGKYQIDGGIS